MQGLVTQDQQKQNDEITKMLKDESGAQPNNLEISETRLSAMTYWQTLGRCTVRQQDPSKIE